MNIKYLANYVRTMQCYFYFLLLQLFAVLAIIIYVFLDFGNHHKKVHVLAIECALTILIILEIVVRIFSNKKDFFDNIWNIIDLIGILLITGLFFGLIFFEASFKGTNYSDKSDIIPAVLLGARYIAQVVRIILTLIQSRDARNAAENHIVFNDADPKLEESQSNVDMSIRI